MLMSAAKKNRTAQRKAPANKNARVLCFDIGGSGIKAMTVEVDGSEFGDRERVPTPDPADPGSVMSALRELARHFTGYDYIACGFPGVIKHGTVYSAHNLEPQWIGYDLQGSLEKLLGRPARVANDAAVQGMAAIQGIGVELCITLGTGMGSSLFVGGVLVPGLELGHHPFRKGFTYEDYLGRAGLKKYGKKKWNKRLKEAIATAERLFNYDHLYLGGGNNRLITFRMPENATLIENLDGLRGGVSLWRDVVQTRHTLVRDFSSESIGSVVSDLRAAGRVH